MDLIDLLIETEYEKKESAKKVFRTYEIMLLIKTMKKINRTEVQERIRAIDGVTTVESVESKILDDLSKKNNKNNFDLYKVKFMSNKDPKSKIESIKNDILHSDPDKDSTKINGVVLASPDFETLKKV